MLDLQVLLTLLRDLPEVSRLEDAVTELAKLNLTGNERTLRTMDCAEASRQVRSRLNALGIKSESEWGKDSSWSVFLDVDACTFHGAHLVGPVIADCRIG